MCWFTSQYFPSFLPFLWHLSPSPFVPPEDANLKKWVTSIELHFKTRLRVYSHASSSVGVYLGIVVV